MFTFVKIWIKFGGFEIYLNFNRYAVSTGYCNGLISETMELETILLFDNLLKMLSGSNHYSTIPVALLSDSQNL